MSVIFLRLLIFLAIAAAIFFGVRRIWRDWRGQFKKLDEADRVRDRRERARPDVITLKRDKDGTFRPGDKDDSAP
jgi:hypothetical protein